MWLNVRPARFRPSAWLDPMGNHGNYVMYCSSRIQNGGVLRWGWMGNGLGNQADAVFPPARRPRSDRNWIIVETKLYETTTFRNAGSTWRIILHVTALQNLAISPNYVKRTNVKDNPSRWIALQNLAKSLNYVTRQREGLDRSYRNVRCCLCCVMVLSIFVAVL